MKQLAAFFVCAATLLVVTPAVVSKADKGDDTDPIFPPGTTKHVSDWIKELRGSDNEKTREKALIAMTVMGPKMPGVVPAVCATLKQDKNVGIRVSAAQVLEGFAPGRDEDSKPNITKEMVDALMAVVSGEKKDPEESVRATAATAMGKMGLDVSGSGLEALIGALKDKPSVQTAAADSIDRLTNPEPPHRGIPAREANEPMLALLKDADAPVSARCAAASFVARAPDVDGRISALTEVLANDKNEARLRKTAAEMLGRFKDLADSAVPALAKALSDQNVELRIAAGGALARVGRRAKDALPEVRKALKDSDGTVRNRAIDVLANLGPDAGDAVKDLADCLKAEKVIENRVAAIKALGLIGPAAKDAVGVISGYTTNPNQAVRDAATEALKRIEGS